MAIHPLVSMDEFVDSTVAEVVDSLVSTPYFRCTYNQFHGVCMAWKLDEPSTSAAAVDEFADRHQWMDRHGTEGSLGCLVEEGVYRVPITLAVR
jgi:hypothetical protein